MRFRVSHGSSNAEAVSKGEVDIGFAASVHGTPFPPAAWDGAFDYMELTAFPDNLYFGIPIAHPLAAVDSPSFSDLAREKIVVPIFNARSFVIEAFKDCCEARGMSPRFEYASVNNMAEFYLTPSLPGLHVMTATYLNSSLYRDIIKAKMSIVAPADGDYSMKAYVFWLKRSQNPALRDVLERIRKIDASLESHMNRL